MDHISLHQSQINTSFVEGLKDRAEKVFVEIYEDYFLHKSYKDFLCEHMHKEGIVAKIASWRFGSQAVLDGLMEAIVPEARKQFIDDEYLLHPIYYLRLSSPDFFQSDKQKNAILDSQPHFDRIFGIKGYTFWVAIEKADKDTGVLCEFSNPDVHEYFYRPWPEKNRYNYNLYLDAAEDVVDPMLTQGLVSFDVEQGDFLAFPWTVLHGATRPQTKRRLSFDFRLLPKSQMADLEPRVQNIISSLNESVDLCNVNNLILVGDCKGAARIIFESEYFKDNHAMHAFAEAISLREPDENLLQPLANNSWRGEYKWISETTANILTNA